MLVNILNDIKNAKGTNAKKEILRNNEKNDLFLDLLNYAMNPFEPFHVVKIPRTKIRHENILTESESWEEFFAAATRCSRRQVTGKEAISLIARVFSHSSLEQEMWMRKVLKKHLSIGVSQKTVNSVFANLIPTFDISLAQKFESKRIKSSIVAIEPKLDGIRCFAIVKNGKSTIYARSGKVITNFDKTIGAELEKLGDGCYDGEIMGEDFVALMRQVYRKEKVDLKGTYLALFDFLTLEEWETKDSKMSCFDRFDHLFCRVNGSVTSSTGMGAHIPNNDYKYLTIVKRDYINPKPDVIKRMHDQYVDQGYEGVMIKDINAPYKFGRGYEVMKYKSFNDVDLKIKYLLEGTGKHSNKLGSFVVCYKGVEVQVGSGLSDEVREAVWKSPEDYIGRTIEVRYQEETHDGSLRFPTFVCFRNDR